MLELVQSTNLYIFDNHPELNDLMGLFLGGRNGVDVVRRQHSSSEARLLLPEIAGRVAVHKPVVIEFGAHSPYEDQSAEWLMPARDEGLLEHVALINFSYDPLPEALKDLPYVIHLERDVLFAVLYDRIIAASQALGARSVQYA
jgi:hypothetical protein